MFSITRLSSSRLGLGKVNEQWPLVFLTCFNADSGRFQPTFVFLYVFFKSKVTTYRRNFGFVFNQES